jgi:hypothetical protein
MIRKHEIIALLSVGISGRETDTADADLRHHDLMAMLSLGHAVTPEDKKSRGSSPLLTASLDENCWGIRGHPCCTHLRKIPWEECITSAQTLAHDRPNSGLETEEVVHRLLLVLGFLSIIAAQ